MSLMPMCVRFVAKVSYLKKRLSMVLTGQQVPHKCGTCEKAFTTAGSLKGHFLIHSGEKSHKCGTCEKAFTLAGGLKAHLLTDSGEKSNKCGTC